MKSTMKKQGLKFRKTRLVTLIVPALLLMSAGQVYAFEVQTDNPDVEMRFDNTLRYNTGWRTRDINPGIGNNRAFDESDYRFAKKGDMITNRLDLYTEFDVTYQKNMGARVSTALWYDSMYGSRDKSNPALTGPNYPGNAYTDYVKRFYGGPSGEILDAFVWSNFKPGNTDLSVKVGRHAMLWGEATFGTASSNSVAFDQAPTDAAKQTISPGATAKETTLPINQMTSTWQLTENFSVSGLYTFEWRPSRIPEGGTYYGVDAALYGPPLASGAAPLVTRANQVEGDSHDKGIALKWRPDFVEGNFGLYYRKFAAKFPTWAANTFISGGLNAAAVYPNDITLWGLSYGSTIMGTGVGAEISHRHNTPLNMNAAAVTNAALGFEGPRGDTWHALVNTTTLINKTDYFTNATVVLELTYQKLDKVTSNQAFYKSAATTPAACAGDAIVRGCASDEAYHFAMLFQPVWAQVYPQTDLTGIFVFQQGLKGNAPTTGIAEGATVLSLGLQADYAIVNRFTVTYTNFWGKSKFGFTPASPAGATQALNGQAAILGDRDNVSFTYAHYF